MLGLTVSAISYAVVTEQSFRKARDDYQGAQGDFENRYRKYSDKASLADLSLGIVGVAWAANVLDAVFQRPALVSAKRTSLELRTGPDQIQLAYHKSF